jgi:hypothetical protein
MRAEMEMFIAVIRVETGANGITAIGILYKGQKEAIQFETAC